MKRVVGILIVIAIVITSFSCRKDVTVEPPPSLTGDYVGEYCLKSGDTPEQCQAITFRFTATRFLMTMDTTQSESDRIFCDVSGDYAMGSEVTLTATSDLDYNRTAKVCNTDLGPFGSYTLDQSQANTVILQNKVGDVTRRLTLELVQQ